jgi:hypothetical protein
MARQSRIATPKAPRIAPTAMKTVPSGRVEWFMKGALRVGGIVGGGYVGISVLTVLETDGMSVGRAREILVLNCGSVRGSADDEGDDVGADVLSCSVLVEGGSRVEVVSVCCGGWLGSSLVLVAAGGLFSVVGLLSFSPSSWATTLRAKNAVRSRARFNERGEDPMATGCVSLAGDGEKGTEWCWLLLRRGSIW